MHVAIKALIPAVIVGGAIGEATHSFINAVEYTSWGWLAFMFLATMARSTAGKVILGLTGLGIIVALFGLGGGSDGDGGDDCGGCDG